MAERTFEKTTSGTIFDILNYTFLTLLSVTMLIPFLHVLFSSISNLQYVAATPIVLLPKGIQLDVYKYIFSSDSMLRALINSVYLTAAGTLTNLFFTATMAYPLAQKGLKFKSPIMIGILITMLIGGGMIPTFFIVKYTGLLQSLWACIIPGAISPFNLIIMRTFYQNQPVELAESAKMDGANSFLIFIKIALPLSMAIVATLTVFYGVGYWNMWFQPILYIGDQRKYPVQVILRDLIIYAASMADSDITSEEMQFYVDPKALTNGVIIVATLPILLLYPFMQRHFVKGVMIGSLKG